MQRQNISHYTEHWLLPCTAAVLTFPVHKYKVIQSDLSTQQFGHVDFVCVQGAEQDLKVDNNVTSGMKLANHQCCSPKSNWRVQLTNRERQPVWFIHVQFCLCPYLLTLVTRLCKMLGGRVLLATRRSINKL